MRTPLLIAASAILGLVLVAVLLFMLRAPGKDTTSEPVTFPVATVTELGNDSFVSVRLENGSSVQVPQFLNEQQSQTASDENGLDVSYGESELFQILYFPNDSYFLISLLSEPLKEARLAAEAELRARLRLQDAALCALALEVFVADDVSEVYSGRDLGLSFCPGSVVLP